MSKDPLSMAQERLEKFLRESPGVKSVLGAQVKNIDSFTTLRGTKQTDVASETDLPEVRLEPVLMPCNANFASNAIALDITWRVVVNTGDNRVTHKLLPLLWALFAAIATAIRNDIILGYQLPGGNKPFKNFTFSNIAAGLSNPAENRGIAGWTAICDLTLHTIFPTTFAVDWNNGHA